MPNLEVPGATLYYEKVGTGPMLLCISGANGSCEAWRDFAESLKDHFTVVMYDRRGFSRSYILGAQDYSQRLERDADDAALLIKHISPNTTPANVIGNSSGAIVALKLLSRHANLIKTLVSYEPPAADFLPDYDALAAFHTETYTTYRAGGLVPAFEKFAALVQMDDAVITRMSDPRLTPFHWANLQYWFEREFMVYPLARWDVDSELRGPARDRLVLVNGELSKREPYQYRANVALGKMLGVEVLHLPGEHVGHSTHPGEFALALGQVLKVRETG